MNMSTFLDYCVINQVILTVDDHQLKVNAPKGALKAEHVAFIKDNKPPLIKILDDLELQNDKLAMFSHPVVDGTITSKGQRQMWLLDQVTSGQPYCFFRILRLTGRLNTQALNEAFNVLIHRHKQLRTTYHEHNGVVTTNCLEQYKFKLESSTLASHSGGDDLADLDSLIAKFQNHEFDLSSDVILKAEVASRGESEHFLLIKCHHIATDGWSLECINRELNVIYSALETGVAYTLPELQHEYEHFSQFQAHYLNHAVANADRTFWSTYLSDTCEPLNLSCASKADNSELVAETVDMTLDKSLVEQLKKLCHKHNMSMYTLFQFAFTVLLSRYSQQQDVVLGTPVANRDDIQLQSIVGYFVNTLPIKFHVDEKESFIDSIQRYQNMMNTVMAHKDLPINEIVNVAAISADLVTQTLFTYSAFESSVTNLGSMSIDILEPTHKKTDVELHLNCIEKGDGVTCQWNYANTLFDKTFIEGMSTHFATVLKGMIGLDSSNTSLSNLSMLSDEEFYHLVHEHNDTVMDYAAHHCIHELFEQRVQDNPEQLAVVFGDEQLTYRELNDRANQLANHLVDQHGVKPDTLIGLCVERSLDMLIGMMGILKAGGAYVPLDPTYPKERLDYMVEDAQLSIIVTHGLVGKVLSDYDAQLIRLDDKTFYESYSCDNLDTQSLGLTPSNLAYVIYTSGSTGRPKGVQLQHQGAVNLSFNQSKIFDVSSKSRVLHFASISFDAATWEWLMALNVGGMLVIADQNMRRNGEALLDFISRQKITHATLPPVFLMSCDFRADLSLEALIVAGEQCSEDIINVWGQHYRLFNAYGPSEASVCASVGELTDARIHIGRTLNNVSLLVLGRRTELLPKGGIGELYIGGDGLARGYLNRPELTAKSFIDNPYYDPCQSNSSKRLYRTGDLVRYLPDGNLEFIGRADDQVKIRGFRIELGEIESRIAQHLAIESALVLVKEYGNNKQLVGYAKLAELDIDKTQLKQLIEHELSTQLPDYMIPSELVLLDSWPLTPNGKIDKKELLETFTEHTSEIYVAPKAGLESSLAEIWSQLLGVPSEKISVNDTFTRLGGNSLYMIRLQNEIRERLQCTVALDKLFKYTTIRSQAREIELVGIDAPLSAIEVVDRDIVPLSFSQQRIWVVDQLNGATPEYNMSAVYNVSGKLELSIAEAALTQIVSRHEVLRTTYHMENGEGVQKVQNEQLIKLDYHDLSESFEQKKVMSELIEGNAQAPFNLAQDCMLRASYIELGSGEVSGKLLFCMHHIASDGWSVELLIREFIALYKAMYAGESAQLPDLPIQYSDYAYWQKSHLERHGTEKLQYWLDSLANIPQLHSLPLDNKRGEVKSLQAEQVSSRIPKKVIQALDAIAQQADITPFMLYHSVLSLVLSRNSQSHDIVVGTPSANRSTSQLESLIGFFVNTLVLRVDTQANNFAEYLAHVKTRHIDAQVNQDVPFELLVEQLNVTRSNAYNPLFQIMFTMGSLGSDISNNLALPGATLCAENLDQSHAIFDLNIDISTLGDESIVTWVYDAALFTDASISKYMTHFVNALHSLTEVYHNGLGSLNDIDMLSTAESEYLLETLNATDVSYPQHSCIHQLFEEQAAIHPFNIAVECGGVSLTYQELDQRANRLAHLLRDEHGVAADTLVGVCIERSVEMIVSLLAVCKAGGAYIPLDPSYPDTRLSYMIEDALPAMILADGVTISKLQQYSTPLIIVDEILRSPQFSAYATTPVHEGVNSNNLAYVIYTSGSTGNPKGVEIEHRGLVNSIIDNSQQFEFNSHSSLFHSIPYGFDAASGGIWMSLISGSRLLLSTSLEFQKELESDGQVTHLMLTPTVLATLDQDKLEMLDVVIVGGEDPEPQLLNRWLEKAKIFNAYGPTEASICCAVAQIEEPEVIALGNAINNTQLFVLDTQLNVLPQGAVGELYIGGDGLARGYLNAPDLTAEKFIQSPFSARFPHVDDTRLYRSGDLVKYNAQGKLEFVGRLDDQVKIRGFRIELTEIETRLREIEEVESALVIAQSLPCGEKFLVAYLKFNDGHTLSSMGELRQHLLESLPDFMVPKHLIAVPAWPLTPNGKIDRKALPEPEHQAERLEITSPRNQIEAQIKDIWCALLQLSHTDICIYDNFFELGGHSLLAVKMISKINGQLNLHLEAKCVFEASTIDRLAHVIATAKYENKYPPIEPVERTDATFPSSFGQQRLWFIDKLQGHSAEYNVPVAFMVDGSIDHEAFERALNAIIERHEVLRTSYRLDDGKVSQKVHADIKLCVTSEKIVGGSALARKTRLHERVIEDMQSTFDLASQLMIDAKVYELVDEKDATVDSALFINMHHIASDGWSVGVLMHELCALYTAFSTNSTPELPPLPVQYVDYAVWQKDLFNATELEQETQYWQQQLAGAPKVHSLKLDKPRSRQSVRSGRVVSGYSNEKVAAAVKVIAKQYQITPFMVMHGLLAQLLSRHSGCNDLVFGTPITNRPQQNLEALIGFFVNTLALRVSTDFDDIDSYFNHIKQVHNEGHAHQNMPFDLLVEHLQIERDPLYSPIFQIMITSGNDVLSVHSDLVELALNDKILTPLTVDTLPVKCDLNIDFSLSEKGVTYSWVYDTALFSEAYITQLNQHFETLMYHVADAIEGQGKVTLDNLEFISQHEQQILLDKLNGATTWYDESKCMHELIEEAASKYPDQCAVNFEGKTLTYRQLNNRANQLAHYLRKEHHTGPDSIVGMCMNRSCEMVIAILGIMKSGGAYLPLDPTLPAARVNYILDNAGVGTVLCASEQAALLNGCESTVVELTGEDTFLAQYGIENKSKDEIGLNSSHLAYVIYTSGTTGEPKGVMVAHKALVNRIDWMDREYTATPNDRILQKTPYGFDVSVWEFVWPLSKGSTLVVAKPEGHKDPLYLCQLIQSQEITKLHFVPSMLEIILEQSRFGLCSSIKQVFCSGEALLSKHVQRFQSVLPGAQLHNLYGPTEAAIDVSYWDCTHYDEANIPIGRAIQNTQLLILDERLKLVPFGAVGELYIGGAGLARGYLNKPLLTAERFIENPYQSSAVNGSQKLYKTGDLVRYNDDGSIAYLGRIDNQVKIGGVRIELGEIDSIVMKHADVASAVCNVSEKHELVVYVKCHNAIQNKDSDVVIDELKALVMRELPKSMQPKHFVLIAQWPLSKNGKVDRTKLPKVKTEESSVEVQKAKGSTQQAIQKIWAEVLSLDEELLDINKNFFDIGGNSMALMKLQSLILSHTSHEIEVIDLFNNPTIAAQARLLDSADDVLCDPVEQKTHLTKTNEDIAIIGMAGRFPDAANIEEYWLNLKHGLESLTEFDSEVLLASGKTLEEISHPDYVKKGVYLDSIKAFDAAYFDINPREARHTCPQHRVMLECAIETLEHSGYGDTEKLGDVGTFIGASNSQYFYKLLGQHQAESGMADVMQLMINTDKDYIATKLAYKLNLTGPAVSINTACSSSLVAIAQACNNIREGQCDTALAGGVSMLQIEPDGYLYQEGGIFSKDGHCRPFDQKASGTRGGSGAAMVLLKPLSQALEEGDTVYAVIKGVGLSNDGNNKVSYTAPSSEGQAKAINRALAQAGVKPEHVEYIETHGTGTGLGDPIEVKGLQQTYLNGAATDRGPLTIGSVKANIGHLDAAAGMAGLLKATLSMKHQKMVPAVNFDSPNELINLGDNAIRINKTLLEWPLPESQKARFSGVSSFGIGGTNAHVVLEEGKFHTSAESQKGAYLFVYSAKSIPSLKAQEQALKQHVFNLNCDSLLNEEFTAQVGRVAHQHRGYFVVKDGELIAQADAMQASKKLPEVVFMFPGQGSQYVGMTKHLYRVDALFRSHFDECSRILHSVSEIDIFDVLYSDAINDDTLIHQTAYAQPLLFTCEYALAKYWISLGIKPTALIGHSLGEYVAATISGIFSLKDALTLVTKRGQLMQAMNPGRMLSVLADEAEVTSLLREFECDIAAVNTADSCVVAGDIQAIEQLSEQLGQLRIPHKELSTSHAFHSRMMDAMLADYDKALEQVQFHEGRIAIASNLTGQFDLDAMCCAQYWLDHIRQPVQFSQSIELLKHTFGADCIYLEVGPGHVLSTFVNKHGVRPNQVLKSLPKKNESMADIVAIQSTLGALWGAGQVVNWAEYHRDNSPKRVAIPTYQFEKKEYWYNDPIPAAPLEFDALGLNNNEAECRHLSHTEEVVVNIWKQLLGFDEIQINDNFFDLGGDSLLAIKLGQMLGENFGLSQSSISINELFEFATVKTLSERIEHIMTQQEDQQRLSELMSNDDAVYEEAGEF
ncbi:hypothetical protein CWB96_11750 [Pseudoalteromonas citrea]|uniref:Non-ribosomal peptide synthetase n=1 Tax=Pseudoalteromonas citrea TaxID=43655 RepID=A0A5S3XPZ0_9GAMM|nr:non-ribosomal peptide synthetase/type I polyketide synthase [Pseudoalteromonas citrea]TMP43897.1 hypothetical protein CWB97_07740 [Pseudoalteromonas citrea]TMP58544.1 hypothetical protein CWB96_11750 [Pseudoalteromonas citrea]